MNAQQNQAVRNLFRTFLRLTHDIERAASQPTQQSAVASVLARHASVGHAGKQFMTVRDIRRHIRDSFRQESADKGLKEQLSKGIQGIRLLESLLRDLQSNDPFAKPSGSTDASSVDDAWVIPYINRVKWLSCLEDEYSHGTSRVDQRKAHEWTEIPLFPLTGAFFQPNLPLELFTTHSYQESPTPGLEIMLKIFEPRYRELYSDLITQPTNRRFVVPFSHPYKPATFAEYGLIYQITEWQDVADETNGNFQYICNHVVTYPVRLHRVLNPKAYHTKETYLRAEAKIEMDTVELDVPSRKKIEAALIEHAEESVATKCKNGLFVDGVWGFIRNWNMSLQQELLQIELQIAAFVKIELQKSPEKDPSSERIKEVIESVQNQRRDELLRLRLDLALSIPRILQTTTCEERLEVILDLIASNSKKGS